MSVYEGTTGDDFLRGSTGDDVINGYAGNDYLSGAEGNDTLEGGDGLDFATYEADSRYLVFGWADGNITVNVKGTEGGTDTLKNNSIEAVYCTSTGEMIGMMAKNDVIIFLGDDKSRNFLALRDHDFDNTTVVIAGGGGDDGYQIPKQTANITVLNNPNEGTADTLIVLTGDCTLPDNCEYLIFGSESAALSGTKATGNALDNLITANSGGNTYAQDDVIDGKEGADTMGGGLGKDTYFVDNLGDNIDETSTLVTEMDTVNSTVSHTLSKNVENLTLIGSAAINGTGNTLANRIIGNIAANTLQGDAGNDSLKGNAGNDKIDGGIGADVLTGGTGKDIFSFTTAFNAKTNLDKITDFNPVDDTIQLENAIFTKLTKTGVISQDYLKVGVAASDSNDYLIYNKSTGALSYDEDGNGSHVAVQIALISAHPTLTAADFSVI